MLGLVGGVAVLGGGFVVPSFFLGGFTGFFGFSADFSADIASAKLNERSVFVVAVVIA